MKIERRQLAEVFLDIIQHSSAAVATKKIATYLVATHRVNELDAIMRDVETIRAKKGQVEINAVSAFPLRGDIKRQVAKLFGAKHALFHEVIDKSVLGGVRFESLDKRLDLTLENKLNILRTAK